MLVTKHSSTSGRVFIRSSYLILAPIQDLATAIFVASDRFKVFHGRYRDRSCVESQMFGSYVSLAEK